MSVMKVVYPRIRNLREDRDWTQQKVADLLFINRRTYSTYETGTHNMTPEVLVKLSAIYEVSVDTCWDSPTTQNPIHVERSENAADRLGRSAASVCQ